jgi:hypothetical protein
MAKPSPVAPPLTSAILVIEAIHPAHLMILMKGTYQPGERLITCWRRGALQPARVLTSLMPVTRQRFPVLV